MINSEVKNQNKVMVGFKCDPAFKYYLCREADKIGISVSSYIEMLLLNFREMEQTAIKHPQQQIQNQAVVESQAPSPPATTSQGIDTTRRIIGRFIFELSQGSRTTAEKLTTIFNQILEDEKSKR